MNTQNGKITLMTPKNKKQEKVENNEQEKTVNYEDLTVAELQEILEDRELKKSGNKDELVARLQFDDADDDVFCLSADVPLNRAYNYASRHYGIPGDKIDHQRVGDEWRFYK